MSHLPSVSFIEGDPPAGKQRQARLMVGWVAYVIAHLESRPGVWAKVDAVNANSTNIKKTCAQLGFDVDAIERNNTLYMRLNP